MGWRSVAAAWAVFSTGPSLARAANLPDAGALAVPPVVVPLPPAPPAEAPARRDPTAEVDTIEAATYAGEAKDTAELLATAPGALLQDLGGLGQLKTLSLRGASANEVVVLLDGIPLNGSGANVDVSRIPAAIIDRMEVLKGGAGTRYGSGGLGGAVNVLTKDPQGGAHVSGEATYGSFGTVLGQLAATGELGGGEALMLLHIEHTQGDFPYGYDPTPQVPTAPATYVRRNDDASLGGALLKYQRPLGPYDVSALAETSGLDRGVAGEVENPTPAAREQDSRFAAQVRASRSLDAGELSCRLYGRRDTLNLTGGLWGTRAQVEGVLGAESTLSYLVGRHGLEATVQWGHEELLDPGLLFRETVAAMVSDQVLFQGGRWMLFPSFRVDQVGPFTGVSPKLGASAQLPYGLEARANLGQAFRAPSLQELYVYQGDIQPNPHLLSERALFADAALSRKGPRAEASVGGFYALYDNLISYEYYSGQQVQPYNFDAALADGLEAQAQVRPASWLNGVAAYTLMFSENLRDDPRYYLKALPYRPQHRLYARVSGGPQWLLGHAEVVYQSEQFVNRTQSLSMPARAFVNAGLSLSLRSPGAVVLAFELKNAFDTQAEDFNQYPLPGRSFYVTVRAGWDQPR